MPEAELHAELREKIGHNTSKALRREGRVPGIFYTHDEDCVSFHVGEVELNRVLHSDVNVINLIFSNKDPRKSIFREVQKDPVTDAVLHVDLLGIKLTEKVRLTIPVILVGAPLGVKEGGILEHLLRGVEVEGLPLEIPEYIEVDVSQLQIGDVITLESIPTEDKFRFVTDIHHAVANVIQPKVVEEAVVEGEEVAEGEEPEGEGAAEGEGEGEKTKAEEEK